MAPTHFTTLSDLLPRHIITYLFYYYYLLFIIGSMLLLLVFIYFSTLYNTLYLLY